MINIRLAYHQHVCIVTVTLLKAPLMSKYSLTATAMAALWTFISDQFYFFFIYGTFLCTIVCLLYYTAIKYKLQVLINSLIILMRIKQPSLIYCFVMIIHEGMCCLFCRYTNTGVELLICKELPRCVSLSPRASS